MSSAKFAAPNIPNKSSSSAGISIPGISPSGTTDNGMRRHHHSRRRRSHREIRLQASAHHSLRAFHRRRRRPARLLRLHEDCIRDEMANHVAAVILDNGQGPVTAMNLGGRTDLGSRGYQHSQQSLQAFGDIDVNDNVEFGTDTGPFIVAGLPGNQSRSGFARLQIHASFRRRYVRQSEAGYSLARHDGDGRDLLLDRRPRRTPRQSLARRKNRAHVDRQKTGWHS